MSTCPRRYRSTYILVMVIKSNPVFLAGIRQEFGSHCNVDFLPIGGGSRSLLNQSWFIESSRLIARPVSSAQGFCELRLGVNVMILWSHLNHSFETSEMKLLCLVSSAME
jgi:hypothetical protein